MRKNLITDTSEEILDTCHAMTARGLMEWKIIGREPGTYDPNWSAESTIGCEPGQRIKYLLQGKLPGNTKTPELRVVLYGKDPSGKEQPIARWYINELISESITAALVKLNAYIADNAIPDEIQLFKPHINAAREQMGLPDYTPE